MLAGIFTSEISVKVFDGNSASFFSENIFIIYQCETFSQMLKSDKLIITLNQSQLINMNMLKIIFLAVCLFPGIAIANVNIEINKTEQKEKSCRVYLVVKNDSDLSFQNFKMDMVLFNQDDIIIKNMALNIAPLQSEKKIVKAFDLKNIKCETVGSILVNNIMQCDAKEKSKPDCISMIQLSSKNDITISK